MLRSFDSFLLSLKVTTRTYNFVSLMPLKVKIILSEFILLALPAPAPDRTQYFAPSKF